MLKYRKKNSKGKEFLYEERPENKNVDLTGENIKTLLSDSDDILKPLLQEVSLSEAINSREIIDLIEHGTLYFTSQVTRNTINDTINDILSGSVALIFNNENLAVTFDVKGFEKRSITEPSDENVYKGAKDAFIEVIRVNTALVRRKIRTQNLRIKQIVIGQETQTPVAVCYIEGIAILESNR